VPTTSPANKKLRSPSKVRYA